MANLGTGEIATFQSTSDAVNAEFMGMVAFNYGGSEGDNFHQAELGGWNGDGGADKEEDDSADEDQGFAKMQYFTGYEDNLTFNDENVGYHEAFDSTRVTALGTRVTAAALGTRVTSDAHGTRVTAA